MKKILAFVLCLLTVILPLASCHGSVDMDDADKGDIFEAYITGEMFCLDPGKDQTDENAVKMLGLIYEGLFRLDEKGNAVKALAKNVKIVEDAAQNVYKMQIELKKTKWSDGNALTADDFVFAWKRLMECTYESTAAALLYDVKNAREVKMGDTSIDNLGISAPNAYLLEISFDQPIDYDNFEKKLASLALVPLREAVVAGNEEYWARRNATLVTNGPLAVKEFDSDKGTMRIERNIYYYRDTEEDHLDRYVAPYRIMINFVKEAGETGDRKACYKKADDLDAIYARFANGEIRYMGDVPLSKRAELKKKAHLTDAASTYSFLMNTENPLLADARVRRALSMALDRAAIASAVVYADPATGLVGNTVQNKVGGKSFRKTSGALLKTSADVEGAKALLKEAGASGGKLILKYRDNEVETAVANAAKTAWEALGFTVTLTPLLGRTQTMINPDTQEEVKYYFDELQEAYEAGDFDILAMDVPMLSTDPFAPLAVYATAMSGSGVDMESDSYDAIPHVTGFADAKYDEIIERAFAEKDTAKRSAILAEAEAYLMEQLPVVPVLFNKNCYLISGKLKGVDWSASGYPIFTQADDTAYKYVPPVTEEAEQTDAPAA